MEVSTSTQKWRKINFERATLPANQLFREHLKMIKENEQLSTLNMMANSLDLPPSWEKRLKTTSTTMLRM